MIECIDVCKSYGDLQVIDHISLSVSKNEIVVILGPSGCGKSTLLQMIATNKTANNPSLKINTQDIGFVFQDDRLLPWRTLKQNIALVKDKQDDALLEHLLQQTELKDFADYYPNACSGGMKKRCNIARAFYYGGDLLLMDEAFSGLDYELRKDMYRLLLRMLEQSKKAVLMVTHDIDEALIMADRILIFSKRPSRIIFEANDLETIRMDANKIEQLKQEIIEVLKKG